MMTSYPVLFKDGDSLPLVLPPSGFKDGGGEGVVLIGLWNIYDVTVNKIPKSDKQKSKKKKFKVLLQVKNKKLDQVLLT